MELTYEMFADLVEKNDAFFVTEQEFDGVNFRIFNYRLASYSQFLEYGALEARGVTFYQDRSDGEWLLASRPIEKFFNYKENPFTMDVSFSDTKHAMLKEDGSLISTVGYMNSNGWFRWTVKSKGSFHSEQALAARKYIQDHPDLEEEIEHAVDDGFTVNMEWCAPDNHIVVGYSEPKLIVLNVRDDREGFYWDHEEVKFRFRNHTVQLVNISSFDEVYQWEGKEGVVVRFKDGHKISHMKIKSDWYLRRHQSKEKVNSPKALVEVIVNQHVDDFKQLFLADPITLAYIEDVEYCVVKFYDWTLAVAEEYHDRNKHLSRKDYAVQGKTQLTSLQFSLIMFLYTGKDPEDHLKSWCVSNARELIDHIKYKVSEE